ncbi:MAG: PPC domain-containing protein [Anaerolineae bacterium]|nr:PPC domain-containing protein [Anaerolineae bacterium]
MRKNAWLRVGIATGALVFAVLVLAYTRLWVLAQGTRIQYGDSVTGDVAEAGDEDVWLFDGVEGDIIAVQVDRTGGDLRPAVLLQGPNDALLVDLAWPENGPSTVLFTASLHATGMHTLSVSGSAGTTGAYLLSIELQQAGGQIGTEGNVLAYGRVVRGEITDTAYRHYWSFRGGRGDVIDSLMTATSGDLDTYLSLVSPNGDVLGSADTGGPDQNAALFSVKLPATGTYTLVARRAGDNLGERGTTLGTYDLALILRSAGVSEADVTPADLVPGVDVVGRLTADAPAALYGLEVAEGVLSIQLDLDDRTRLGIVAVMTPGGALLGTFSGVSPLRSSVTLPGSGTIWVEVTVEGIREGASVDFVLSADQLVTARRASRALLYGRAQQVGARMSWEPDAWHFAGQAGDLVQIEVQPFGPVLDGEVQIFEPGGELLVRRVIANSVVQPLVLAVDGLYEVFVNEEAAATGYRISIDQTGAAGQSFEQYIACPDPAGMLSPGAADAVSGSVPPGGAQAWAVEVADAQTWLFQVEPGGANSGLGLAIKAPDGKLLSVAVADGIPGPGLLKVDLPHAGRFSAAVFDLSGAGGSYTLTGSPIESGRLALNTPAKGALTPSLSADAWALSLPPDALLNIRVTTLSPGSSQPTVHVIGADGLLTASNALDESRGAVDLLGIPTADGGTFQIVLAQAGDAPRTAYTITADIEMPFESESQVELAMDAPVSQQSEAEPAPVPYRERVSVPDQITPPVDLESDLLRTASRIEDGALARGEIAPGAAYEAWTFNAVQGQMLSFSAVALDENSAGLGIVLLSESGSVLVEHFQRGAGASHLMHRAAASGTYYVLVTLKQGARYTLTVERLSDIDEHVPDVLPGQVISFGEVLFGELVEPDDTSQFAFYGHAGDIILASASRLQGDLGVRLALSGADGVVLGEASMVGESSTADLGEIRLAVDGIYRLEVAHADGEEATAGQFVLQLNLQATETASERGGGILAGQRIAGLSIGDPQHHWLFDAQAGEQVTVHLEPLMPGAPIPLRLQLADTAGHVFLHKEIDVGHEVLSFEDVLLPRSGVYQAVVSGGRVQTGMYRITLERDLSRTTDDESVIRYGDTVGKVLTGDNFLDVWTFAGSQGDVVSILARPVRGDAAFIGFQLRTGSGSVVATAADDGTTSVAYSRDIALPSDGHYAIVVGNLDGEFEGQTAYELTIQLHSTRARSVGSVITYGQNVEGAFYADDRVDTWLFEGRQGDIITAEVAGETSTLLPWMALVSTDWHAASVAEQAEQLASVQAAGDNQSARIDQFVLPESGPYALVVQNAAYEGGNYRLELAGQSTAIVGVKPIEPGIPLDGLIAPGAPLDGWVFEGVEGASVTVAVTPGNRSALAPAVMLLAPDGVVLVQTDAPVTGAARIEDYRLPLTGVYTVVVTRALGEVGRTEGSYVLEFAQVPPSGVIREPITYDQLERGVLDAETPVERWSLDGQQGDVVRVRVETTSGNLDPVAQLRLLDGDVLAWADDGDQDQNTEFTVTLPQGAGYEIEVSRYGGALGTTEGNYTLLVERVYRFEPLSPDRLLAYGDRVTGTVDGNNRSVYWIFAAAQGDIIRAKAQFAIDDSPLSLSIYDPSGDTMATAERSGGSAVIDAFEAPTDGLYTLEVRRPSDARASYSPYTLSLELVQAAVGVLGQGGVVGLEHPATGQFREVPGTHTWFFYGQAGQDVSLSLTRLSGALGVDLSVLAPDGSLLNTVSAAPGSTSMLTTGAFRLPLDGMYTLLVAGDASVSGLIYRLTLQPVVESATDVQQLSFLEDGFGAISDARYLEHWAFEVSAGQALSLRLIPVSGNLAPTLTLWGPDGRPLIEGVTEDTSAGMQTKSLDYVAPQSGTYVAVVSRLDGPAGDTSGAYRILLRQQTISALAATAADIPFGQEIRERARPTETQAYAFQGLAGDVVAVALRVPGGHGVPALTLETERGAPVSAPLVTNDNEAVIPGYVLPDNGRYVIGLSGDEAVEFRLVVLQRERVLPASGGRIRRLVMDRDQVEGIDNPEQPTHWTFSGTAGDVLTFTVDTSGSSLRADVMLYGPQGYIAGAVGVSGSRVVVLGPVRLPDDGDYVLVIGSWLGSIGGSTGGYTVHAETAPAGISGSNGGHIPGGVAVAGGLIPEDNQDTWTFDGRAGEVITIRAERAAGNGSLVLELLDHNGTSLAVGQPDADISAITLPADGTYQVRVTGTLAEAESIEYRLAVIQTQEPVVASVKSASGIAYGEESTGMFSANSVYQAWVFYGRAGERITGWVESVDGDFSPVLYLVGPGADILFADVRLVPGATAELAGLVLPENGFYGLVVGRAPGSDSSEDAAYTIRLDLMAAGAVAQGVLEGESTGHLTAAAPVHEWVLAPDYAGQYLVQMLPLMPGAGLSLFVLAADDEVLATGAQDASGSLSVTLSLGARQSYAVMVSGGPGVQQAQYTLRLLPASMTTGGGALALPAADVGRIWDDDFSDEWTVQGTSGSTLVIEVRHTRGDLAPVVSLFDQNGLLLQEGLPDEDGVAALRVELPVDGRYSILVSRSDGAGGTTSGDYALSVQTE